MSLNFGKIFRGLFYLMFWAAFIALFVVLFVDLGNDSSLEEEVEKEEVFKVIFPDTVAELEPTFEDMATKSRLVNVFESLVQRDKDLNLRPALATNWGLIDDLTWEFSLRENVKFHDETSFDVQDVIFSLERALNYEKSQLREILDGIEKYEALDDFTLRIYTAEPDPVLLQRLSTLRIVPEGYAEGEAPVGTGPYEYEEWLPGDKLVLKEFQGYWGEAAKFESVEILEKATKAERLEAFFAGEADFYSGFPYEVVQSSIDLGYAAASVPSLEVQFLLFNFDGRVAKDLEVRRAIARGLDPMFLSGEGFVHPVGQFVSSGIFGFNPRIEGREPSFEIAQQMVKEAGLEGRTVQVHIFEALTLLGEHIRTSLVNLGINPVVSYLDLDSYMKSLERGDADIYFVAFRGDLGDAGDFYDLIFRNGEGEFAAGSAGVLSAAARSVGGNLKGDNFLNYENDFVEDLVEKAQVEMDEFSRRNLLQEIMRIMVEEDVLGIPLFEYDTVYVYDSGFAFEPRIDNLIYFNDITFAN